MKKIIVFSCIGVLLSFNAFAAEKSIGADEASKSVLVGPEVFRVSNNVQINVNSTSAAYAAISGHLQGTRQYGTTSLNNALFEGEKTAGGWTDFQKPGDATTLPTDVFKDFKTGAADPEGN